MPVGKRWKMDKPKMFDVSTSKIRTNAFFSKARRLTISSNTTAVFSKSIMGVAKCTWFMQLGVCAHRNKMTLYNERNNQRRRRSLTTGEAMIKRSYHINANGADLCQKSWDSIEIPYFLEISPHLEIPSVLKSHCIFQPTHPNKRRPRNLATCYGVDKDISTHTSIMHAYKQACYWSCVCACVSVSVDATLKLLPHGTAPWN